MCHRIKNSVRDKVISKTLFSWAPKSLQMVTEAMKLKALAPWKKNCDKPR